jgi:hypothetical protein
MALASFAGLGRTERRIWQDAVLRVHLLVHQHRGLQGLRAKLPDEASNLSRRHATGTRSLDCHRHAVNAVTYRVTPLRAASCIRSFSRGGRLAVTPNRPEARVVTEVEVDVATQRSILLESSPAAATGTITLVVSVPGELDTRTPVAEFLVAIHPALGSDEPKLPVRSRLNSMNAGRTRSRASRSHSSISTIRHRPATPIARPSKVNKPPLPRASSLYGTSSNASQCFGRTTLKSLRLSVATTVSFRRSAIATTEASTSPKRRSA